MFDIVKNQLKNSPLLVVSTNLENMFRNLPIFDKKRLSWYIKLTKSHIIKM